MSIPKRIVLFSVLAAALVGPFLAGLWLAGTEHVFGGFLLNPQDGNSYLAKMRLGWLGEWRFQLPYSLETSDGAYLFLFYILLGHLARITTLSIPLMFHLARLFSAAFLVYAIFRLYRRWLGDFHTSGFQFLVALTLFGSGLGWIAGLFGGFTSDFWVAEAYPFLSMYTNPHFPLGLGLLLIFFDQIEGGLKWMQTPLLIFQGLAIAIIQPFALVVGAVISAGYILWEFLTDRRSSSLPAAGFTLGGGLFLVYQYVAIQKDPVLSLWNEQNITSAPPVWDLLISFSPALIFAIVQVVHLVRNRQIGRYKLFVVWLAAGVAMLYLPFNLQRRFLLGFFIPCAFLGALGVMQMAGKYLRQRRIFTGVVLAASLVTNLFVLLGGIGAAARHEPLLFFSRDEQAAFGWINEHSAAAGPILASEETGMYIPAYTGWRVVYGHPFETINAEQRKAEVEAIFSGSMNAEEIKTYFEKNKIRYVFWGPHEQEGNSGNPFADYPVAYQNHSVTIYTVGAGQ
jgi:hypothetical protein